MRPESLHVLVLTRAIAPLHGVGGLERHGRDLVEQLLARGAAVTLVTQPPRSTETDAWLRPERLAAHFIPYRTFPGAGLRGTTVIDRSTAYPIFGWRAGRLAARLVTQGSVHIVHGMGAASLGYAAAREADRFETVPFILNPHGMEEFGATGSGLGAAKRLAYAPLRRAVRRCAGAADRVIATDAVLAPTVQAHLRVPEERIAVVPNAVDLDGIDRLNDLEAVRAVRARALGSRDEVLMVAVGRLEPNKGFHVLIDALARLAQRRADARSSDRLAWTLVLLGDGSERTRLERLVAQAGLGDRVTLAGRVSDAELHAWYEAADLFVHPSLYEGSSLVTLEAMAHGRAVVATRAGGLPDKVRPGVNGWLVPPGDVGALAAAMDDALQDRDRLRNMGEASRAIVERQFAWPAVMDRLLDLYDHVLRTPWSGR